ncbi:MAG: glycosyltransferase family 2 protein [Candidatus Altiarchaeota archaeon]|nr:glycosyltransferase family 2 protein [Candidatus Altiarchaeota archaeon]
MDKPKVSIVILNWNGWEDTLECLKSLHQTTYPNYDIIVVDNGSTDNSPKILRRIYSGIDLIENKENIGFGEGNNVGINYALNRGADYILLLNNDTTVDPKFLSELVEAAEGNPDAGILGSKIYYYHKPEVVWLSCYKINSLTGLCIQVDKGVDAGECDYVAGCAMLIRKEVFDKIGLFDPDFYLYGEDAEFCIRASFHRGYRILYVPTAKIYHKVSASSKSDSPIYNYYISRNVLLLLSKNRDMVDGYRIKFLFHLLYISGRMMKRCFLSLLNLQVKHAFQTLEATSNAICDFYRHRYGKSNRY